MIKKSEQLRIERKAAIAELEKIRAEGAHMMGSLTLSHTGLVKGRKYSYYLYIENSVRKYVPKRQVAEYRPAVKRGARIRNLERKIESLEKEITRVERQEARVARLQRDLEQAKRQLEMAS